MESIDSPKNPTPRLKVVPPNQIKPPTSSPATQKLPIPAQLPTQPETTLPIPNGGGGSGGSGGSQTIKDNPKKIPHTLIMVGTIVAALIGIGLIPIGYEIKTDGTSEPNPEKDKKILVHQGTIVKEISSSRDFKEGELVISTIDPLQEEKLRKAEQEILEAQSQKKLAETEELTKKQELEQAMSAYRSAVNSLDQSQMNLVTAPITKVYEAEIEEKRSKQANLRSQLAVKQGLLEDYTEVIERGGISRRDVISLQGEIMDLEGQISSLDAQISASIARNSLAVQELMKRVQEDSDQATEKKAALDTAEEELGLGRQKVQELNNKIKQLEQEKIYQKDQQKLQKSLAPFDGVAELEEIKNYAGEKLSQAIEIPYYSPSDMMLKLEILQIDYCRVQKGDKVKFVPNGGTEYKGEIHHIKQKVEEDTGNADQRLATVWVKLEKPNQQLTKGMTGKASIDIGKEQIYKIVWKEIYKIIGFMQSVPDAGSCKQTVK